MDDEFCALVLHKRADLNLSERQSPLDVRSMLLRYLDLSFTQEAAGLVESAFNSASHAISIQPSRSAGYIRKAELYFNSGKFGEAQAIIAKGQATTEGEDLEELNARMADINEILQNSHKIMPKPTNAAARLAYSVVSLQCHGQQLGTGFFMELACGATYLVSCRHVLVDDSAIEDDSHTRVSFVVHVAFANFPQRPLRETAEVRFKMKDCLLSKELDIAAVEVSKLKWRLLNAKLRRKDYTPYISPFDTTVVKDGAYLREYTTFNEQLLMYSHAGNRRDAFNDMPLLRCGLTASHPGLDYDGLPHGMASVVNYYADAGTPLCIIGQHTVGTEVAATLPRSIFLGMIKCGYTEATPKKLHDPPMSLARYIKASKILSFLRKRAAASKQPAV